jgi:ubiquinone/menaquinone biosynthesis C-methylase UbiE
MLESYARHDYPELVPYLPIHPGDDVLDAGGGTGALASMIRAQFSHASVTVGDLAEVVALPDTKRPAVVLDLFTQWPVVCDVVVLARVLHDWGDEDASRVLASARLALRPEGRLAVLDFVRPDEGFRGALCDLHLLAVTGGKERRESEWRRLLHASGFEVQEIVRGRSVPSLISAKAR